MSPCVVVGADQLHLTTKTDHTVGLGDPQRWGERRESAGERWTERGREQQKEGERERERGERSDSLTAVAELVSYTAPHYPETGVHLIKPEVSTTQ